MDAQSHRSNDAGERTTYLVPMRRRVTATEGSHHAVFGEISQMEVTAFLRQGEEFKRWRVGWGGEEQKKAAISMKELNKTTIRFRGAKLEHFGRSGGKKEKLVLIGKSNALGQ